MSRPSSVRAESRVFGNSFLWEPTLSASGHFLSFPLDLPDDDNGVAAGSRYRPFLAAGRGHARSTGCAFRSPKFQRPVECQSWIEASLARILHLNPYLVDLREHYVIADQNPITEALLSGKRLRKTEVPTIDLIATFRRPTAGSRPTYHGFSVKASTALSSAALVRRLSKDKIFCDRLQWRWSLFTERDVNTSVEANARRIIDLARDTHITTPAAYAFARGVVSCKKSDPLEVLLRKSADSANISNADASSALASAVLNGFLVLEPSSELRDSGPLALRSRR